MGKLRRLLLCLAYAMSLAMPIATLQPAAAWADAPCGEDNQTACHVTKAVFCGILMPDGDIPVCWEDKSTCNNQYLTIDSNNICQTAHVSEGLTCCAPVDYMDNGHHITAGYYAVIDLTKAWIVIPNLERPTTCNNNREGATNIVQSIPDWANDSLYTSRLKINANFFDVSDNRNPYYNQCTNALGLTISNKEVVSVAGPVHGAPTSNLAFMTAAYSQAHDVWGAIVEDAVATYGAANIQNAISGYRLLRDNQYVPQPAAITPELYRPRAAVGISYNTHMMYLVVVNPGNDDGTADSGGTTLPGLAAYLNTLGAHDALTLDGSGSAQLDYYDPRTGARYRTRASDNGGSRYRPVPIFLGVE